MSPDSLRIFVLEGHNAINSVEMGLATPPVVEVRDRDDRPVEAATVVFRLPANGPGGFFPDQQLSKTVLTNVQGQAMASGLIPNQSTGRFKIHVTATAGNRTVETDITQTNTGKQFAPSGIETVHKKMTWWKWTIIGGAAAGLTIGIILATRGGSSPPTITITPGPVTIGQ
jgi:hypothetical protein